VSAQHTHGPWLWIGGALQTASGGQFVLWPRNAFGEDGSTWAQKLGACGDDAEKNAEANARLIAAAPELLAELQAAHRLLSIALGCMTPAGQATFGRQSAIAGLGTDGASRFHERETVISKVIGTAS